MSKQHEVVITKRASGDSDEHFSFEASRWSRRVTAIARDNTGDVTLLRITAEQAREVVDALAAAIDDLETPQVGDIISSTRELEKLPNGSILRSPATGRAYWRDRGAWHNPVSTHDMNAYVALTAAGGPLELLYIGEDK